MCTAASGEEKASAAKGEVAASGAWLTGEIQNATPPESLPK
jgi:hypothetical protein